MKHQNDLIGSGVFIINFEHVSRLFLVFLLFNLNKELLIVMYKYVDHSPI